MNEIEQAKVTILGDANAGKSSIIQRYVSDTFASHSNPTIGATFLSKVIDFDQKSIKLSIWDTAGQERYHSLASSYSRDSRACILVYDITHKESFTNLEKWHNAIKDLIPPNAILVVVGNKDDMVEQEAISLQEAQEFAYTIGALNMRTSAKLGTGINELFLEISKRILGCTVLNVRDSVRTTRSVSLMVKKPVKAKKPCC